ncbi:hypothetical protein AB4672_14610 [Bacillus paralicheniformis]|nr:MULTISPECIES: hypothetical protein [Bacillus]MEC4201567.1 hypothetical protein [Bacillus sp. AAVF1]
MQEKSSIKNLTLMSWVRFIPGLSTARNLPESTVEEEYNKKPWNR